MFPSDQAPTEAFPYRVEGQVGLGSMGRVYRATETALDRTVAIKVLRRKMLQGEPPEVQHEIRQRFMQEARAAAALSHPGATTVYRVGEHDGLPFIVMEWLQGKTLEDVMEERPHFSVSEAARLGISLLETLQAAHQSGVVHRDIKPSNLVILDDGRLKITDFGIARLQGRELVKTQAGVVLATPKFAAPEQLRGIEVDGRTDLFATGILLYRLLTGHYPFEGKGFMELATTILQAEPAPMREYVPELPPQLDSVIRVALRKDPKHRFASAADMADALRPFGRDGETAPHLAASNPLAAELPYGGPDSAHPRPILQGAPDDLGLALAQLVSSWPSRPLDRQPTTALLDRLLDQPLHTHAFSGAAMLGDACLLICNGTLVGAVHQRTGERGNGVVEQLQAVTTPTLHPLPESFPRTLISVLSSVLHPLHLLHSDLDSSFINLPNLAARLRQDRLNGVLKLHRGQAYGLIFFHEGEDVLSVFSTGWDGLPIEQPWQTWVSSTSIRASVAGERTVPLALWYRRSLANFELLAQPVEQRSSKTPKSNDTSTSSRIRQLFQSGRSNALSTGQMMLQLSAKQSVDSGTGHYQHAPAFQFLGWALNQLPSFLSERKKIAPWKYLSEWIPLVRQAKLHHELPRPGSRQSDFFDLVTFDSKDKVLHLGHHFANPTVDRFHHFLEQVLEAKTARLKTGDIGGVFLIASSFSDDLLSAYSDRIQGVTGIFGLEDSFTGYAGFVRLGTRRGFHLMLVEHGDDGFTPILPD